MENTKYADISLSGKNVTDVKAVLESVRNILSTKVGERVHNRKFGCNLQNYLFQPFSFSIAQSIKADIIYALAMWEPRVTVLPDTTVNADYDNRTYEITLMMSIKGLQGIHTISEKYKTHTIER